MTGLTALHLLWGQQLGEAHHLLLPLDHDEGGHVAAVPTALGILGLLSLWQSPL